MRREKKTIVSSPRVISVVDDDASVRVATDNLLSALGYIVHTFASAEEFLRSPHFHDTSCVIADVQMPDMSGVELQAILLDRGHRVPFIFITAFPGLADVATAVYEPRTARRFTIARRAVPEARPHPLSAPSSRASA